MTRLNLTPQRTEMFEQRTAQSIRQTHAGMAHFADTGPHGAICKDCSHFDFKNKFPFNAQICRKYMELAVGKKVKDKVPAKTPACKYYEARK